MFASVATADVNITDRTYVRHDGGTDATIASCNSDAPGVDERRRAAAERADGGGRSAEREQDDGGRRTTTAPCPRPPTRGPASTSSGDGGANWVEQPAARIPDRHLGRGAGVAALRVHGRARATRCRTGTGAEPSVLRRDRVQPHPADQRFDLGRAIQLERAVRRPGLRVHDDRFPRDADRRSSIGHFDDKVELEADDGAEQPVRRGTCTSAGRASRRAGRTTAS